MMAKERSPGRADVREYFSIFLSQIDEPRVPGRCDHGLNNILVVSFCAILAGAESYVDIEDFGQARIDWFRKYLGSRVEIPSHDTFRRVLSLINPVQMETAFFQWVKAVRAQTKRSGTSKRKQICLDGKSIKGTERNPIRGKRPLHLVSAYDVQSGLVLGQRRAKSSGFGEISAIEACLELFDLKNILLSFDAASSYPRLLSQIRKKGGHFLCPIKKNHKRLHKVLSKVFQPVPKSARISGIVRDHATVRESSHGRQEKRSATVLKLEKLDDDVKELITAHEKEIKSVIRVCRRRDSEDRRYSVRETDPSSGRIYKRNKEFLGSRRLESEDVYYISDLKLTAHRALEQIRLHWSIENNLHWHLDVAFGEDDWRVQDYDAAQNLAILRKMAFNTFKRDTSKGSLRSKIKRAAWDSNYLERLLFEESGQF